MKFNPIYILVICLFLVVPTSFGPPNCNLYKGDCKEACHECEKAIMHGQGSRKLQIHFDKSIALCPSFAYAYYEKAVPYAKRGQMKDWKVMIDNAVKAEPQEFLGTRGWYHFFFMHNYEAAISDIEKLEEIQPADIGFTGDGFYHLKILKAFCHRGLGDWPTALSLVENQIKVEGYVLGMYDYLHLGVLQYQSGLYDEAIKSLELQKLENDVSENYFYLAQIYQTLGQKDKVKTNLETALAMYDSGEKMKNSYRQLPDEIFRLDIVDMME